MRHQGKIAVWKDDQGYGFIAPNAGGPDVFLHIKAFIRRGSRPVAGQLVAYEALQDGSGRWLASRVEPVPERRSAAERTRPRGPGRLPLLVAGLFLTGIALAALGGRLPGAFAALYAAASAITFIAYALDKSAARQNRRRTRESTLHLLALAGGWPGALAAQNRLRHKSSKPAFLAVFRPTVVINCLALGLYLSPAGRQMLSSALT